MNFYTPLMQITLLFLKERNPKIELMNKLNNFANFSGIKPNKIKCEIAGAVVVNGV